MLKQQQCGTCLAVAAVKGDISNFEKLLKQKSVPIYLYWLSTSITDYKKIDDGETVMEEIARQMSSSSDLGCTHVETAHLTDWSKVLTIPILHFLLYVADAKVYSMYLQAADIEPMQEFAYEFHHLGHQNYHFPRCHKGSGEFYPLS